MDSTIIRDATGEDAGSLADLAAQLGYPSSAESIRSRLGKYADNPDERVLAAELDGRVVGWTSVGVVDHFYTPVYVEISGFVVDGKHRSAGIGAALMGQVKEWAKAKGVGIVRLRANVVRVDAHRFYEREGFTKVKEQFTFETKVDATGARDER
ncbi:MAG TPA: GNAT family N-acetyltransferase [Rectinemataceae bacterium]|nr:GNAT family N-acetyltransferase [Rectinemataceae bacterium]